MSPIRTVTCLCLLVAAVFTATPAEASAARKHVRSSASLESVSADGVAGTVGSRQGPCRAKRAVDVYMVNSGSPRTSLPVGTAITSGDGSWSLGAWAYPGEYYAVVQPKKTKHFLCRTATSNSVAWWTSGAAS
jgi:hypothetical protein